MIEDPQTEEMAAAEPEEAKGLGTGAAGAQRGVGAGHERSSGLAALDRIREKVSRGEANATKDLDVPGYDGELAVRYKVLPFERAREIELAAARDPSDYRELRVMCDELIDACECVLWRGEDGQMHPLEDGAGRMVRYDARLAEGLGLDAREAREVILGVFAKPKSVGRDRAPYMVSAHFDTYLAWIRSARASGSPGE